MNSSVLLSIIQQLYNLLTAAQHYYFKFVRGKKQKDEDLDFFDDEGYEEEPYINEDDEPVIADDEDDGNETKETEETL